MNGGTARAFDVGDRVVDIEQDPVERGDARVVEYAHDAQSGRLLTATEVVIDAIGETVAGVNGDAYRDDAVVAVVFESTLDHEVPAWQTWDSDDDDRTLAERLDEYGARWGVWPRRYHYPEGRLRPVTTCADCGERRVYIHEPEVSGFSGYVCDTDDCPTDS